MRVKSRASVSIRFIARVGVRTRSRVMSRVRLSVRV